VIVYTVGHSTLSLDEFLARLRAHGVAGIADVRRFPASRRHPQYGRDRLAPELERHGIRYDWLEALGGRRAPRPDSPHAGWRVAGFRGYADYMDGNQFASALAALLDLGGARATAIMCAEAVPWRCHRQLVADALVARGVEVRHILGREAAEPHRLTAFARVVGERLVYDGAQGRLRGV